MAASSWPASIAEVLASEGGFVDHPRDPGGATNFGVTLAVFKQWRGTRHVSKNDLIRIEVAEVRAIYEALYWNVLHADELPHGVDHMIFDAGVNTGNRRAAVQVQRVAGMDVAQQDGVIGPRTLAAIRRHAPEVIIASLARVHEAHYRSLGHFPTFGRGWLSRLERRIALANELLREA